MSDPTKRPRAYSMVSFAIIIASLIFLFSSVIYLGTLYYESPYKILALFCIIVSFYSFFEGYGLKIVKRWSWINGMIVSGLNFILALIFIFMGLAAAALPLIVLYGLLLYYLRKQNVKAYIGVVRKRS